MASTGAPLPAQPLRLRWSPPLSSKVGQCLVAGSTLAMTGVGLVDGEWALASVPAGAAVILVLGAFGTSIDLHKDHPVVRNLGFSSSVPLADPTEASVAGRLPDTTS